MFPTPSATTLTEKRPQRPRPSNGFTLIEVLASLVLVAIMASLLLPLIGTGLRAELDQFQRQQGREDLRQQMDAWLFAHRQTTLPYSGTDIEAFREHVATTPLASGLTLQRLDWITFDATRTPVPGVAGDILRVTLVNETGQLSSFFPPSAP